MFYNLALSHTFFFEVEAFFLKTCLGFSIQLPSLHIKAMWASTTLPQPQLTWFYPDSLSSNPKWEKKNVSLDTKGHDKIKEKPGQTCVFYQKDSPQDSTWSAEVPTRRETPLSKGLSCALRIILFDPESLCVRVCSLHFTNKKNLRFEIETTNQTAR